MAKNNTYDIVDFFYKSDPDWNLILDRQYVEEFLRLEAFQGKDDEELYYVWMQILSLCYYVSLGTTLIGDLSPDDFIDCIAWCGRNLPNFALTSESVGSFLNMCDRLLKFLKNKHSIFDASAASLAREKLVSDNNLLIINADGTFKTDFQDLELHHTPDLRIKISLNEMGESQHIQFEMLNYFQQEEFELDILRATSLFFGIPRELHEITFKPGDEPSEVADFWDYFLFDYSLLQTQITPVQTYNLLYKKKIPVPGLIEKRHLDLLRKFATVKLTFFKILNTSLSSYSSNAAGYRDDVFDCLNVFTGEKLQLCLPFDLPTDLTNTVFMSHIFPDGNIMSDYVRSVHMGKLTLQRTKDILELLQRLYQIQKPAARSMDIFIHDNAALVISIFLVNTRFYISDSLLNAGKNITYEPALIRYDEVTAALKAVTKILCLPARDQQLMLHLWSDYCAVKGVGFQTQTSAQGELDSLMWAMASIYAFFTTNHGDQGYIDMYTDLLHLPAKQTQDCGQDIIRVLGVTEFDPRYLGEEGFITLAHLKE